MVNKYLNRDMLLWGLKWLLVLFFLVAGIEKLRGSWHIASNFEAQGLSMGVMYVVGVLEIVGALGLLVKSYARSFAVGLGVVSLFTAVSSARVQLWDASVVAVIVLALLAGLMYGLAHSRSGA